MRNRLPPLFSEILADFRSREANNCSGLMEAGRDKGNLFMSKYTPVTRPPDFPKIEGKKLSADNDPYMPEAFLSYRNRRAYGTPELHDNAVAYLKEEGIEYDEGKDGSCFACGSSVNTSLLPDLFNSSILNKAVREKGEVLICTPTYNMLPQAAIGMGRTVIEVPGDKKKGYKPDARMIREALHEHPDARVLAIVNPANPTGVCLSQKDINEIARVVKNHNLHCSLIDRPPLLVVCDETFRNMLWDKLPHQGPEGGWEHPGVDAFPSLAKHKDLHDCTITLRSFSKDMAPALGFAYAFGPPALIKAMSTGEGPSLLAQQWAASAFSGHEQCRHYRKMHFARSRMAYEEQYHLLVDKVAEMNKALKAKFGSDDDYVTIPCEPDGGFHVAVDFSGLKDACVPGVTQAPHHSPVYLETSRELAQRLMEKCKVVTYPGEMFWLDGEDMILRLSVNLDSPQKLADGMDRIKDFCLSLTPPEKWVKRSRDKRENRAMGG